jgi:hypothetical protein
MWKEKTWKEALPLLGTIKNFFFFLFREEKEKSPAADVPVPAKSIGWDFFYQKQATPNSIARYRNVNFVQKQLEEIRIRTQKFIPV